MTEGSDLILHVLLCGLKPMPGLIFLHFGQKK